MTTYAFTPSSPSGRPSSSSPSARRTRTSQHHKPKLTAGFRSTSTSSPSSPSPTSSPSTPKPKKQITVSSKKPHEPVQPLKSKKDIEAAKDYLLHATGIYEDWIAKRNYMMFVVNINNALRISDLLEIRIEDILTKSNKIKDEVYIQESKTGKTRHLFFGPASKQAIEDYLDSLDSWHPTDYLFASRKLDEFGRSKPISRIQAWRIISKMGKDLSEGRDDPLHLGTHSMRKTFGLQRVLDNPDDPLILAQISEIYNHSNMAVTYRYLGLDIESKREICLRNEL